MTTKEIIDYVKTHPAGRVKIAYIDVDGILRGKYIASAKFLAALEKETSFCNVILGWDAADALYDNTTYTGWHTGYPDALAKIDLHTFRKIPAENDTPFFLGALVDTQKKPLLLCPRQLLKKVEADAARMGYTVYASQEFEWYNFAETPQSIQHKSPHQLTPLTPGMFGYSILRSSLEKDYFAALFEELKNFDIPLEGIHTETGPGTYEAAIQHTTLAAAGDRAVLFKNLVKEIAYRHGIMATFMAKVNESLPGCGGHIHQSLWDKEGKRNLFFDPKDKDKLSLLFRQFIAGQLYCLPYLLPLYAPTINSYKRLVEGAWAPVTLTWGVDNRTTALRVLNMNANSCRLETRVPGADMNPCLAMAAAIASGLYGIKKKMKLSVAVTKENGYRDFSNGVLPATLQEATQAMKESGIAKELFGKAFTDHFIATREWEWRQHLKAVTDWEYKRYFEII